MRGLIGVNEAAFEIGVRRPTIHAAMEAGLLMWVDVGGSQMTTKPWLRRWKRSGCVA